MKSKGEVVRGIGKQEENLEYGTGFTNRHWSWLMTSFSWLPHICLWTPAIWKPGVGPC